MTVSGAVKPALEAILMVADTPQDSRTLASVLDTPEPEVEHALRELAEEYTAGGRGFELRDVGEGWRYYTRDDYVEVVERFVVDGQQTRLTQAALETLAVIAYRQPVSRARIAAIRGVSVDGVVRTLVTRGLVEECGTEPVTGANLYRTTAYFLERIGLSSLDLLPEISPFLPEMAELEDELTEPVAPAPLRAD
jgi:segregation and condensation protein B